MKWTTATALLLMLGAGGVGALVALSRTPETPDEVLADIRERMSELTFDKPDAVARLETVLENDELRSNPEALAAILRARSDIYRDLGEFAKARVDLETLNSDRIAAGFEPDPALRLEIAELMAQDGQEQEALQQVRALTRVDSKYPPAWKLEGKLLDDIARGEFERAAEQARTNLASSSAEEALEALVGLTAREIGDPERDDLLFRLSEAFRGARTSKLNEVLEVIKTTPARSARARVAFANSIQHEVAVDVLLAICNLFERAGRIDLGIQLQMAAQNVPDVAKDPDAVASLVDDLLLANRLPEAMALVHAWDWKDGGTLDFFRSAGEVLYKAEQYRRFGPVIRGLERHGSERGEHFADFYRAIRPATFPGDHELENPSWFLDRMSDLRDFALNEAFPEPFPGARDRAWFHLADGYGHLGRDDEERRNLERGLELLPDVSADRWVRLAEILRVSNRIPWAEIELCYTRAMNLAPERTTELESLWYEAGEEELKKRSRTIEGEFAALERRPERAFPVAAVGPSVLTRIAQYHLDQGRDYHAIRAANMARADFPNLIPPLDVKILAELENPARGKVERDIIERIELAGMSATIERAVEQLPEGQLNGEWLVRAIRAAPARFGKAAVARWYLDRGQVARAGEILVGVDDTAAPADLALLRARLLIDQEDFGEALEELRTVGNAAHLQSEKLLLMIESLIGAGRNNDLEMLATSMQQRLPAGDPTLLQTADLLATAGRVDLALAIVNRLDQRANTRTVPFYRRRVLLDLMAAPEKGSLTAQESILRAEPYVTDGTPEIAAILLAVADREWTKLADLVDRLESSSFRPTDLQRSILALLGEHIESGERAASSGLERRPRDARWALVAAASDVLVDREIELPDWYGPAAARDAERFLRGPDRRRPKDPRDALAVMLVAEVPAWHPWAEPRARGLIEETGSTMWGPALLYTILESKDLPTEQRRLVERIQTDHPRFGAAHDWAVQLAAERYPLEPLHPDVVRTRSSRLASLGPDLMNDEIEVAVARAGEFARDGKFTEAVQELIGVIPRGGPRENEGRVMLSILEMRAGEPGFAAVHLHEAAKRDLGAYEDVALEALVESIAAATVDNKAEADFRAPLDRREAQRMLAELSRRYPDDPIIALERVKLGDGSPEERANRARGFLEQLRKRSSDTPLNELRPGATRRWVEFFVDVAPQVAADLVEAELEREPGNLELLRLAGEVAEAADRLDDARRNYETYLAIDPDSEIGYELVELMISAGAKRSEIARKLSQADRFQAGGSARSTYLNALAKLRDHRPELDRIIRSLAGLWKQRSHSWSEVSPLDLGRLYVDALMRRATSEDLEIVDVVIDDLREIAEGELYEPEFLSALSGIRKRVAQWVDGDA